MANIIEYLPLIISEIEEYQQICQAENLVIDDLQTAIAKWLSNKYPTEAAEQGIAIWEEILQLMPQSTDSLEDRRLRVLGKLNERLPYDRIKLYQMMASICGWDNFSLQIEDGILDVNIFKDAEPYINNVYEMLLCTVPANLLIKVHQYLETKTDVKVAAFLKIGTTLTLLPYQEESISVGFKAGTGGYLRLGTKLTITPREN